MVYLIIGTVAQKQIGLYQATQIFFYAPIIWYKAIPLPGMPIFMGLFLLNLTCYVFLKNPFHKEKIGTLISHIGVILLIIGGFYTLIFSQTGYIDLAIGEKTAHIFDYHQRDFVIEKIDDNTKLIYSFDHIKNIDLPFTFNILQSCENCDIKARVEKSDIFHGMAQHMALHKKPLDIQNEENMAGISFEIEGSDNHDGVYLVLEDVPQYPEIKHNNQTYRFKLHKSQRNLPFSIQLTDFRRTNHDGIGMAKSYESDVILRDHSMQWEETISMNKPLRYKGYTIFQSSFIETPIGERSVFSVVQNSGRAFPYIAGFAICFGMFLHIIILQTAKRHKS